ncbi:MAG: hypothetical protein V5A22_10595 [Salinivenus sp.]
MPLLSDRVRDRLPWRQLLVESVLVVLSVLLALALNAWYDHSQEQEKVRRALRGLHAELVDNRKRLQFRVSHHRALLDTFRTDSLSFRKPLSLRNIDINTQAWETAQQTGTIGLMDYEVASRVSGAYARIEDVEFLSRKVFDLLFDGTTYLGLHPNEIGDFGGFLNDLTRQETRALRQTTRALDAIEARMPALARSSSDPAAADSTSAMRH